MRMRLRQAGLGLDGADAQDLAVIVEQLRREHVALAVAPG